MQIRIRTQHGNGSQDAEGSRKRRQEATHRDLGDFLRSAFGTEVSHTFLLFYRRVVSSFPFKKNPHGQKGRMIKYPRVQMVGLHSFSDCYEGFAGPIQPFLSTLGAS